MNSKGAQGKIRARVAITSVTALWGATFTLNKLALVSMPAPTLTLWRFVLAAAVIGLGWGAKRSFWRGMSRREVALGLLTGALLFGGYILQLEGQYYVSPSVSGFITGLSVVLVPIFLLVYRVSLRPSHVIGAVGAAVGLYLLANPSGKVSVTGAVLTVVAAAFFGLQIVVVEQWWNGESPFRFVFIQMAWVALFSAIACPLLGAPFVTAKAQPIAWISVVVDGVGASALAFVTQAWALSKLSSLEIAVIYSLEPIFAVLVAGLVLGVVMSMLGWLGGIIIIGAMSLVALAPPVAGRKSSPSSD